MFKQQNLYDHIKFMLLRESRNQRYLMQIASQLKKINSVPENTAKISTFENNYVNLAPAAWQIHFK
jgi:hypothetical protein